MIALAAVPFLLAAVMTDLRARRVPNAVTYPMALIGVALAAWQEEVAGALGGGLLAGAALLLTPGFRSGGGDMKLAMACGTFLGVKRTPYFLFFFLAGTLVINLYRLVAEEGWRGLWGRVRLELAAGGQAVLPLQGLPGAPVMAAAFLAALFAA